VPEKKVTFIQMVHSPSFLKDSGARLIFGIVNEVHLGESKTGATISRYL
jgi:hypothetical protein